MDARHAPYERLQYLGCGVKLLHTIKLICINCLIYLSLITHYNSLKESKWRAAAKNRLIFAAEGNRFGSTPIQSTSGVELVYFWLYGI
jgi:hypothetical protein